MKTILETLSSIDVHPPQNRHRDGQVGSCMRQVLIAEDDADARAELEEAVMAEGYRVVVASDGEEALKILEDNEAISILIADIHMPKRDGLSLIGAAATRRDDEQKLATVVLSNRVERVVEAFQNGIVDFLPKPVSHRQLMQVLQRAEEYLNNSNCSNQFGGELERAVIARTKATRQLSEELADQNRQLERRNGELAVANRVKSDFLNLISHELRTPLNAMIGGCDLLSEFVNRTGTEEEKVCLTMAKEGGNKMLHLVNTILAFVEAGRGDFILHKKGESVGELIERVVELFSPQAQEKNIKVLVSLTSPDICWNIDHGRMVRAVGNLVQNAIHHSATGSVVKIKADFWQCNLRISVIDHGTGISARDLSRALAPFGQVDTSYSKQTYGLGLGLPLARLIAEAHNGFLTIESDLGKGTTARLIIPRANGAVT